MSDANPVEVAATVYEAEKGRSIWQSMLRGALRRCPRCGEGKLLSGYAKQVQTCSECGLELGRYRADDGPAYFTIFVVGHIVVPLTLWVEKTWTPSLWVHAALWLPITLGLAVLLLPPIKGAVIGVQWALDVTSQDTV